MGDSARVRGGRSGAVVAAALASAVLLTQVAVADEPGGPAGVEEQRERASDAARRAGEVRERVAELD
uniref:hypothetical protein n=1 Tax=Streptomyces phytophilus TaxID=722715 RepID=UPI0035A95682